MRDQFTSRREPASDRSFQLTVQIRYGRLLFLE